MAVVENKATQSGDVITIRTNAPIIGVAALTGFLDSVENETASRFFDKQFRYALDGINYTQWNVLTTENIAAIPVTPSDVFIIEYRYTRKGSDNTGDLVFNEVEIQGTYVSISCGATYQSTFFYSLFGCNDPGVLIWAINVLEKLYSYTIIAKYLTRKQEGQSDKDYIDFWYVICKYFAIFVYYMRSFRDIDSHRPLLEKTVSSNSLYFSPNESHSSLKYLKENAFDEIRKRGTLEIAKDTSPSKGELLRLLDIDGQRELIFGPQDVENFGWVVDRSSPLYEGQTLHQAITKSYEFTDGAESLANYPLKKDNGTITIETINPYTYIAIDAVTDGQVAGIGMESSLDFDDWKIPVSSNMDYEISFFVRATDPETTPLTFGFTSYDVNGNSLTARPSNYTMQTPSNTFINKYILRKSKQWYFVRGIIRKSKLYFNYEDPINIGVGTNWVMDHRTRFIIPTILCDAVGLGQNSSKLEVRAIKINVARLSNSQGFIQPNRSLILMSYNNNGQYNTTQLQNIIRQELIPYNIDITYYWLSPDKKDNDEDVFVDLENNVILREDLTELQREDSGLFLREG